MMRAETWSNRLVALVAIVLAWSFFGCSSSNKKDPEPKPLTKNDKPKQPDPLLTDNDPTPKPKGPESPPDTSGSVQDAVALIKSGDLGGAKSKLKGVLIGTPDNHAAYYWLAVIAERENESDQAEKYLRQALKKKKDYIRALEHLCNLLIRARRISDADLLVMDAINKNPKSVDAKALRLKLKLYQKDYAGVIRGAKQLRKLDVDNMRVMIYLAQAYFRLNKLDLALYILQYAKKVKNAPELGYFISNIYLVRKQRRLAQTTLEGVLRVQPNFPEALNNLGVIYHQAGAYGEAIAKLKKAVKLHPRFIDAYLNLGNSYRKNGDVGKSQQAYKKALRINRDYPQAYYNLAILYLESKITGLDDERRYGLAIEYFNKFKSLMGAKVKKSDPIDKYINEAKKRIVLARKQKQRMKKKTLQKKKEPKKEPKKKAPEPKPKKKPSGPQPLPLKSSMMKSVEFTPVFV